MRKTQILMNKPVYLGLSILDLGKTVMYEFWYDYVKPKYGENTKLSYMDTDSFTVHVKTDDIYKDIAENVETRFDTSNFEIDRPLTKGKNIKVIELMKEELGTKTCIIKRKLEFQDYQNCLEAAQIERKINYLRKKKIDVDSLKEDKKEFVKNNKLLLKTQLRFIS